MEEFKLGIAPIGWSNDDMPELGGNISFEQCIDDMATAGFTGTEIGNKFPKEPRMLKDKLAKKVYKLSMLGFQLLSYLKL